MAIAITDQEAWCLTIPAAAFYDLLRYPLRRGMLSHLDMQHFTAGVADYEEGMEGLKPQSLDAEKITDPDLRSVPIQEGSPTG